MKFSLIENIKITLTRIKRKIKNIKNGYVCDGQVAVDAKISKGSFVDKYSVVGNYTFINTNCTLTKAIVGNYCSIGSNVVIGPGEHDLSRISISGHFYNDGYEELTKDPVEIGHDVWIGTYSIIMRGVKVGTGAVIGAGAIVTKNVPEYAVVVGVPAKIIKYRFNNESQKKIFQTNWFMKNINQASKIIKKLEHDLKK